MSTALTNFHPEEALVNGEDDNNDFITLYIDNPNASQELTYIPKRLMICGQNSSGTYQPMQVGNNGEFLP